MCTNYTKTTNFKGKIFKNLYEYLPAVAKANIHMFISENS